MFSVYVAENDKTTKYKIRKMYSEFIDGHDKIISEIKKDMTEFEYNYLMEMMEDIELRIKYYNLLNW